MGFIIVLKSAALLVCIAVFTYMVVDNLLFVLSKRKH